MNERVEFVDSNRDNRARRWTRHRRRVDLWQRARLGRHRQRRVAADSYKLLRRKPCRSWPARRTSGSVIERVREWESERESERERDVELQSFQTSWKPVATLPLTLAPPPIHPPQLPTLCSPTRKTPSPLHPPPLPHPHTPPLPPTTPTRATIPSPRRRPPPTNNDL